MLVNLANTCEESGLPAESLAHSREALDLAQSLGMAELEGDIHHNIGNALAASGDVEAEIAQRRQRSPREPLAAPARPEDLQALGLTPREAQVLFWVALGKTNDDVTTILATSLSAVKKHLVRIYEKLGVENRTAAANVARRAPPPPTAPGGRGRYRAGHPGLNVGTARCVAGSVTRKTATHVGARPMVMIHLNCPLIARPVHGYAWAKSGESDFALRKQNP